MNAKKQKLQLMVKPLESKVTPYCCSEWDIGRCNDAGGTYTYVGDLLGFGTVMGTCSVDYSGTGWGKLAAVADY